MRELGQKWKQMSDDDKAPYATIAVHKQAELFADNDETNVVEQQQDQERDEWCGPWSFGSGAFPVRTDLLAQPPLTRDRSDDVAEWLRASDEQVKHQKLLPERVSYDSCCTPGVCRTDPAFAKASRSRIRFNNFAKKLLSAYVIIGEGGFLIS